MRNEWYRDTRTVTSSLFIAAAGLLAAGPLSAGVLDRLSADYQNNTSIGGTGEKATNAAAGAGGAGGLLVYTKTVAAIDPTGAPLKTLYVTFSAQGDAHRGSALLMTATVDGRLCQPLLGQTQIGGGGPHVQTGWYTLSHLPQSTTGANCNDGGGGTADCHDNTIYFSCCAHNFNPRPVIKIKLADLPGGGANVAFYERSTIYIDGERDAHCTGAR